MVSSQQQHGRLLRMCITDGHSKVTAIEYRPMPSISEEMVPGTKVCLVNATSMQSGILLLEAHSLRMLGGCVQSLYEEWEIDRKYSGFSRSTLKLPQIEGSSGPPPFERLHIQKPLVESAERAQFQVYKSKGSHEENRLTAKQSTLNSTDEKNGKDILVQDAAILKSSRKTPNARTYSMHDNMDSLKNGRISTAQVRAGYEPYRPKASQYRLVESLSTCIESVDKTSVPSSLETESVLTENEKVVVPELIMTSAEVNNNMQSRLRNNETLEEGYPDGKDCKMTLVAEAVPVQNQAAAQKLLKKMSYAGREGHQSKNGRLGKSGAGHSRRDKREETALLTLDEWELQKGKMKATSSRSDNVSQDEELARRLQNQLDLEAANVKMAREDEAEQIRMSMFNFGNMSNSSENSGRKLRGRGRGRRRFQ